MQLCVVAWLNVYLPDDLAAEAEAAGLDLSAVTQEAVRMILAARSTNAWLTSISPPAPVDAPTHEQVISALDHGREEAPTRHG